MVVVVEGVHDDAAQPALNRHFANSALAQFRSTIIERACNGASTTTVRRLPVAMNLKMSTMRDGMRICRVLCWKV
jgi:hypothetical protein